MLRSYTNVRTLRFLCLVLLDLAVCFVFIECALHLNEYLHRGTERSTIVSINGLAVYTPNIDQYVEAEDVFATGTVRNRINADGYVGRDHVKEKRANVVRIAVLGDSYAAMLGVDTEKSFVPQLEQALSKERPVEIYNFGVGGQGTIEEAVRYIRAVAAYSPDITLLILTPDDLENNHYYLPYADTVKEGRFTEIPRSDAHNSIQRTDLKYKILSTFETVELADELVRKNPTLERIAIAIGLHSAGAAGVPENGIPPSLLFYATPLAPREAEVYTFTGTALAALKTAVEQDGGTFAVVYMPEGMQVNTDVFEEMRAGNPAFNNYTWNLNQPQTTFGALLSAARIPYFDLTPALYEHARRYPGIQLYANRKDHPNQAGNDVIARALVPFVENSIESIQPRFNE